MKVKYEEDFYGWTMLNAQLLKNKNFKELDIEHLVEEIESMGRREKNELFSLVSTLIEHLLKIECSYPNAKERNQVKWESTVKRQKNNINKHLQENPSLKSILDQKFLLETYEDAVLSVRSANDQYGDIDLKLIPTDCPYTLEYCLSEEIH